MLTALDLTALGIGSIIGAGIFVLTGKAAHFNAGPGIVIAFLVAGFVSSLASLCYAELASSLPVSGSAYSFTYATLGELMAWIIGWDLMLEYLVGAATVAVGWSGYLVYFLQDLSGGRWSLDKR
ncbi:Cationic amino acid transporter-1, partial [Kappamyces sp. JEL0680]